MAFESTKREWCELYTFFKLLADGKVTLGTADAKKGEKTWPIAVVQREEHDGTRQYIINGKEVIIKGESGEKSVPREDFGTVAQLILQAVKSSSEDEVASPVEVEAFLDAVAIFDLEACTEDRTDLYVGFWTTDAPLHGFSIRSRIGSMDPLLDGGRSSNLKLEQSGVKFATPTVNKINASPQSAHEVAERMLLIERLGGILKYADVADKVFRCNLSMIDLHFPRMLAEMVRIMHLDGISRISELTEAIRQVNPLKIKDELLSKHGFYEFKIKQFLAALLLGMRPAKIYTGEDSAIEGLLLMDGSGEILCYHKSEESTMKEFLFLNTRLEKGSLDKDRYGYLEKENGVYYFKLNAKISLVKR